MPVERSAEWLAGAEAAIAMVEYEVEIARKFQEPPVAIVLRDLAWDMRREFGIPKPDGTETGEDR
jgi:hypothetical protein